METVNRISLRTTIRWGRVKAPVALFKTTAESKEKDFERAGPNGKPLLKFAEWQGQIEAAQSAKFEETLATRPDPLAAAPAREGPPSVTEQSGPPPTIFEVKDEDADPETARAQAIAYAKLTGNLYVEEKTEELVLPEEIRRGVRLDDGTFVDATAQLEEIQERTQLDEMSIISFIRIEQVPRARIKGSYYLGHDAFGSSKLLKALYDAMRATDRTAVVKWTKTTRQALGLIRVDAKRKALVVLELEWAENWRDPSPRVTQFQDVELTGGEFETACDLVLAMADSAVSLDELRDDARAQREELRERALSGALEDFTVPAEPETDEGPLEDALRGSVAV